MNLHEFQSKKLFADYGLPVPKGIPCRSVSETGDAFDSLGGSRAVVKCQVYAGGRGKSGGVKVVSSRQEAEEFAGKWLGNRLVTYQTGKHGQPVSAILVEQCSDVARELYLGAVIDRSRKRVVFMASTEGGTEIEKVARETPELIFKEVIEPLTGPQPFQGRELGFKLGLNPDQIKEFTSIFLKLGKMFEEKDLSLLEINPLVVGADGHLVCLDAKINIDSNALFRHKDLAELIDWSQSEPAEARASQVGLNYVALDGNIGCMVNGAGLAMATMDMIKLYGGDPANFLDIGGSSNPQKIVEAMRLLTADKHVNVVLINIFGGITRCDDVAKGLIEAFQEIKTDIPIVIRLTGTNEQEGREILKGTHFHVAHTMSEAGKMAVELSK